MAGVAQEQQIGSYELLEKIGSGSQASVYRARDLRLERNVALKVLDDKWTENHEYKERFLREARLAASIDHLGIVTIYDVGEDSGQLYIAMEYVSSSLQALIDDLGRLPIDESLRIVREITSALGAAHEKRIVHRDIKPGNILLTETSSVRVEGGPHQDSRLK